MGAIKIGDFLRESIEKTTEENQYPVLTSSQKGIFPQADYFNKKVASKSTIGYKIIREGQFTYRAMSDTGRFYVNRLLGHKIGIVSPAYPVFEIAQNDTVLPEYVSAFFQSEAFQKAIALKSSGSTRVSLKLAKIEEVVMEPPCLDEQRKQLRVLSAIDQALEKKRQQLVSCEHLVKSRFIEMFGDPIENTLGWPTTPLCEIAPAAPVRVPNGDNVWLLSLDAVDAQTGNILFEHRVCQEELSGSIVGFDEKHVLYSKLRPYLNKVVLPSGKGACTTELVPLRPKENLERVYLAQLLRSDQFVGYINTRTTGTKMPRVDMKALRGFEVMLPPRTLQQEYAAFVRQVDKSKYVVQQTIDQLELLKASLMQEYFG